MQEQVQKYQYLWDGSEPQWALLSAGNDARYLIVDTESKMAMIIEDDVLARQVIERMLAAGVRVVSPGAGY